MRAAKNGLWSKIVHHLTESGTFIAQVNQFLKREVEISKKIKSPGFHVIKDRWVVEHTFAWLNNSRRLSKDYEISIWAAESFVYISHLLTLLKRL